MMLVGGLFFFIPGAAVGKNCSFYVQLDQLRPTQVRYSQANVDDKVTKAIKRGDTDKEYSFCAYDGGKSIFSLDDAIPVVKTEDGAYYLCDGHHAVLASYVVGAKSMPVFVIETYPGPGGTEGFWEWACAWGYAYLKTVGGQMVVPTGFTDLIDDPVRYFVALSARKFEKELTFEASTGAEYPLWVKIKKDIPFIEFHVADVLVAAGFVYRYGDEKNKELFQEKIEQARAILRAVLPGCQKLKGLKFLPEKEQFEKSLKIRGWLENFIARTL